MRKPTTGEPYAGEPHVRFGGRGGESLSYPYQGGHDEAVGQAGMPSKAAQYGEPYSAGVFWIFANASMTLVCKTFP